MYLIFALLSAIFAAIVSILTKIGMKNIDSDEVTFIPTIVVLFFTLIIEYITKEKYY